MKYDSKSFDLDKSSAQRNSKLFASNPFLLENTSKGFNKTTLKCNLKFIEFENIFFLLL